MPTYQYRNTVTGDCVEVVQPIKDEPFETWGEIFRYMGQTYINSDGSDPVVKVPNWEGNATIYGEGVYKQGLLSGTCQPQDKVKHGATRLTAKEIMERKDEEDE